MASTSQTAFATLGAACLVYLFAKFYRSFAACRNLHGLKKLPGPRGWPFVGYLKAAERPAWLTYWRWSDEYDSDVVAFYVLGTTVVILNSLKAATELLEARSAIYSDRPTFGFTMLRELVGFDWNITVSEYGPYWRDSRRAFAHAFHPHAVARYRPAELKATHQFLRDLLNEPEDFHGRIRYLVDLIPILKYVPEWFPGAGFKRQARIWKKEVTNIADAPFAAMEACDSLPDDSAAKPLLERMLDSPDDPAYARHVLRGTLASMYIAGADTTTSTLATFFHALSRHPAVLYEAQRAVDRVCAGRLPTFADYDALPYIHALLRECLRWRPVVPLNFAHRATKEDVYEGYRIPAGALVLANNWAIMHDPAAYTDPEDFNPRRFLRVRSGEADDDLELDPDVRDPGVAAFGFGRRACPGRHMAYESLWIAMASVLAVFDVLPAEGDEGEVEYTDGFLSTPKPFRCIIRPRSAAHAKLVYLALELDA
uniref:Cytochrome P450 n=1 Tax=Phanerodontia chrysosporium TaxID=2822231 RepID=G5EJW9_PHACH|nr:cytochrome P450 [Phanerodontia chrysosporium]